MASAGPAADPTWLQESEGVVWCASCRALKREHYPNPIACVLRSDPRGEWSIGIPFRIDVPLYRTALTDQIRDDLQASGFVFGECLCGHSRLLDDYVTMYTRDYVLLRGDKDTITKVCPLCGAVWTDLVTVYAGRPAYVMHHQLSGARIYQGRGGKLYITQELVHRIDWTLLPDIRLSCIEVRRVPLDGRRLPGDPDWDGPDHMQEEVGSRLAVANAAPQIDTNEHLPIDVKTESSATLTIRSPSLIPDEITELLRCEPSFCRRSDDSGLVFGVWEVRSDAAERSSVQSHLDSIMKQLPAEVETWRRLAVNHELELVVILYLGDDDPRIDLDPSTMAWLGERAIRFSIRWDRFSADEI